MSMTSTLAQAIARLDLEKIRNQYFFQDEAVVIDQFIPAGQLESILRALPAVSDDMHRSYVPGLKKSSSVSRFTLNQKVPAVAEIYKSPHMVDFLNQLTDRDLRFCPEIDPHSCTLYCYLNEGDYFGGHYDTNLYRGTRFTVLLGLVNDTQSKLVAQLYKKDNSRQNKIVDIALKPGTLVVFNCHRLYHWVTPLKTNEKRIVLALEYVTDTRRSLLQRLLSDLKDAVIYFGFKRTFGKQGMY